MRHRTKKAPAAETPHADAQAFNSQTLNNVFANGNNGNGHHAEPELSFTNVEAEKGLLGCALSEPKSIPALADKVEHGLFNVPAHRFILDAIVELERAGTPVNAITVTQQLGNRLAKVRGRRAYRWRTVFAAGTLRDARCRAHCTGAFLRGLLRGGRLEAGLSTPRGAS